jgi:hypothetical protein
VIIPDFQNMYTNKSYLSREEQVILFRKQLEIIRTRIPDASERYMLVNLHGLLFTMLSEADFNEIVFMISDLVSNQLIANYAERLNPEHIIVLSNLDEATDYHSEIFQGNMLDYFDFLQQELQKKFTILILPYKVLEGEFIRWLKYFEVMLAYRGRIILLDCPQKIALTDSFRVIEDHNIGEDHTIKVLQTNKKFIPGEQCQKIANEIMAWRMEIDEFLFIVLNEAIAPEVDIDVLNRLIAKAWHIEGELIHYHDDFPDADTKYRINEIKDALLDVRYSEKKDLVFFIQRLKGELLYLDNMLKL